MIPIPGPDNPQRCVVDLALARCHVYHLKIRQSVQNSTFYQIIFVTYLNLRNLLAEAFFKVLEGGRKAVIFSESVSHNKAPQCCQSTPDPIDATNATLSGLHSLSQDL